jgi:hypothetical protein
MPHRSPQSVEVKCEAAQYLPNNVVNSFLVVDPGVPPRAEYILTTLRTAVVNLKPGSYYRVTFEEIAAPGMES